MAKTEADWFDLDLPGARSSRQFSSRRPASKSSQATMRRCKANAKIAHAVLRCAHQHSIADVTHCYIESSFHNGMCTIEKAA